MQKLFIPILFILFVSSNVSAFQLFGNDKNNQQVDQQENFVEQKDRGNGKRKERMQKLMQELNLSEDQITKFKEIKAKHKDTKQSLKDERQRMKSLQQEIKQAMQSSGAADRSAILSKIDTVHEIKGRLKRIRVEMALDIREILNPEQLTKFNQLKEQKRKARNGKRNKRKFRQ